MGTNPFGYLKNKLYRSHCSLIFVDGRSGRADLLGTSSFGAGISAIILGGLAFLPRAIWAGLVRASVYLWAYALIAAPFGLRRSDFDTLIWPPNDHLNWPPY